MSELHPNLNFGAHLWPANCLVARRFRELQKSAWSVTDVRNARALTHDCQPSELKKVPSSWEASLTIGMQGCVAYYGGLRILANGVAKVCSETVESSEFPGTMVACASLSVNLDYLRGRLPRPYAEWG